MIKKIFSCCAVEKEVPSVDLSRAQPISRDLNPESNVQGQDIDL